MKDHKMGSMPNSIDNQLLKTQISLVSLCARIIGLLPRSITIVVSIVKALWLKNNSKKSLGLLLEKNALKFRKRNALLFEDKVWTHDQLNKHANQYANYFKQLDIVQQEVVVVYIENRPELLFIVAGLSKIGAVASLVNPNLREEALAHSIKLDKNRYIIVGEELFGHAEKVIEEHNLGHMQLLWSEDEGSIVCPKGPINLKEEIKYQSMVNPDTTRNVECKDRFANIFTSGTTGMPKAAVQTHRRFMQLYYWFGKVNLDLSRSEVLYVPIPFYHSNALMVAWSSVMASGASIVMRRKFSTSDFWEDIRRYGATSFIYIGEICRYLYNQPPSPLDREHRIEKILGNGLRPEIWMNFKERFGIKKVLEFYGSADGNIAFTNTLNFNGTIGWTPARYAVIKYDIENETPFFDEKGFFIHVNKGETGLLISHINRSTPLSGYVHEHENHKKIFRDVFKNGDAWFNSGDLVRNLGYGHLAFVDRIGDTFRYKGENVSTTEVEKIVNAYSGVIISAVYGVEIPNVEGKVGMLAFQTENQWDAKDLVDFQNYLEQKLPSYAIPVFVRFCKEFEITATQKIKKGNLKSQGFDIYKVSDPIYVNLSKTGHYTILNGVLVQKLLAGDHAF